MIADNVSDTKRGQSRLSRSHHLTWTADLKILLGNLEPVTGLFHYRQTLNCLRRTTGCREQYAITLFVAASYAPSELVKLRQTKPFRVFNHHNTRVRNVDPNFDHCS